MINFLHKNYFLFYFSVTTVLYTIVYLIKSFVIWNFTNPFQWLIDMPTYSNDRRALIIFLYFIYHIYSIIIYQTVIKEWHNKR